jgi:hypothetical protein
MSPKATDESAIVDVGAGDRDVFPVKALKEALRWASVVCMGELDGRTRCRGVDMLKTQVQARPMGTRRENITNFFSCAILTPKQRSKTKTKTRQAPSVLDAMQPRLKALPNHLISSHLIAKGATSQQTRASGFCTL